jgi:hypothetical protein
MNYIVSGLERSGTSLMMQILDCAGFPIACDNERKPDINNPEGYYELYNGRIIDRLDDIDVRCYDEKVIKITSYGIKKLNSNINYKIIYMIRNLDEVYQSQNKMMDIKKSNKKNTIELLDKINKGTLNYMLRSSNIDFIVVNYNNLLKFPYRELKRISTFLNRDITQGEVVIKPSLWRNRK